MKKAIIAISALLLSVSMLSGTVQAAGDSVLVATSVTQQTTYSGTCGAEGSDVTWTYDTETETLTISGTGKVEAYVENGATIKTPGWMANAIPFEATHVVIEDGITDVGEGFCEKCFGDTKGALKLEVSESVKSMDLESLLNNENVYFYGKTESWFYYSVYRTDRFISTGTAIEKYVPTSGTYSDGATWSYDIETRTLTVNGNGMITESEYMEHFGQSAEKVVFGKDVEPPDRTDSNGLNLFLYSCIAQYTSEDGPEVCLYRNSVMGAEYEKLYAYQLEQSGKDEEWVNQHYPVTLLECDEGGDLYIAETYGTVDGGATWEFDCSSRTLVFDNGTMNKVPSLDQIPSDVWHCTKSIVWGKNLIPNETTASLDSVTYNAFVFQVVLSDPNFTKKTMYCYADSAFAKEYEVLTGNPDVFNNLLLETQGKFKEVRDVIYLNDTDALPYTPVDKTQPGGYIHLDQTSGILDGGVDWTFDCTNRILTFDNGTFDCDVALSGLPDIILNNTYSIVWGKNLTFLEDDTADTGLGFNYEVYYLLCMWRRGDNKEMYCYTDSAFFKEYEKIIEAGAPAVHEMNIINETVLYGDTNLDGRIDIIDAVFLNKAASGSVQLNPSQLANADCNGDGTISVDDGLALLRYLVHLEESLPIA